MRTLRMRVVMCALLALSMTLGAGSQSAIARDRRAQHARTARVARGADAPASGSHASSGAKRAPSSAPLSTAEASAGGDQGGSPHGEVDPLLNNGLGSPLCKRAPSELSATSRRDCETSGFIAARAPTGNYGIDVHIDTGVLGLSSGGLLSTVQDLFVTPVWMALVWAVHALVVMLEWCFTIDLLDSPSVSGGVGRGLRQTQLALTDPWLATVLAVASVLALYNGLIRRRVAETLGQTVLLLAMMLAGMWVMLDPTGTVGALGRWANDAGLGTLAVTTRGTPARAGRALADSMSGLFAAAIEVPWCYLEFGDVGWCRSPARLDPRLRAAGLGIAAGELRLIGCKLDARSPSPCVTRGSGEARTLEHSAQLLRDAPSNGAIFLALPANGSARNSINDEASLLRAICQSSDATNCRGPAAAPAEFRTNGGTWARVGGLLLIVVGVLGMILLLGFIALRLLAAALFSLLYLMLAPAAVLAPALGEGGRAVFRRWGAQLLGAVASKLLFSFLLGVVLAIVAILADLEGLGWWTQWLLMSAFWWGAYLRRHQALEQSGGVLRGEHVVRQRSVVRRASDAFESPRRAISGARSAKRRLSRRAPDVERRPSPAEPALERVKVGADDQAARSLAHDRREALARSREGPEIQQQLTAMRAQLARVRGEQEKALGAKDGRRAAVLAHRAQRIARDLEREQHHLSTPQASARGARGEKALAGRPTREQLAQRGRFLDAQAALPAAASARGVNPAERRDYLALAGLAGYGRREYERLDERGRRAARLEVDRELASRRELSATAGQGMSATAGQTIGRDAGRAAAPAEALSSGIAARRYEREIHREPELARSSSVMRDAREVASGRKRQLGRDRR